VWEANKGLLNEPMSKRKTKITPPQIYALTAITMKRAENYTVHPCLCVCGGGGGDRGAADVWSRCLAECVDTTVHWRRTYRTPTIHHHCLYDSSEIIRRYFNYREHAVAQLVEALRGFDSRWCLWNFSLTLSFRSHYGPGVDSVSNRNEYQEYFLERKGGRCVGLTTLSPSCADCIKIWEPQGLSRPVMGLLFYFNYEHMRGTRLRGAMPVSSFCQFFLPRTAAILPSHTSFPFLLPSTSI
jgi:hypothetical protein